MRTVGQALLEQRQKLQLSLEEIERHTRIRKNILKNLEAGNWSILPSPTNVKGFIKVYGKYLGLDTAELLALYRREVDEKKFVSSKTAATPHFLERFPVRPHFILIGAVVLVSLAFFGYLYSSYRSLVAAPYLEILEPGDNIKINSEKINIAGKTDTDSILKVNGDKVDLSPGGTFSVALTLPEGPSTIFITSENRFGGISRVKRDITVELQKAPVPVASSSAATQFEVTVRIGPNSAKVKVDSDVSQDFDETLSNGTQRVVTGAQSIKVSTSNAGSTEITYQGKTEKMGKEGEVVEREFKP